MIATAVVASVAITSTRDLVRTASAASDITAATAVVASVAITSTASAALSLQLVTVLSEAW